MIRFAFAILTGCLFLFARPGFTIDVSSYLRDGVELSQSGNYRAALVQFNQAIEFEPTNALAYQYRGVAKAKYGDFEGSVIDYSKSIEIDPNNSATYGSRGIAKARISDLAGAILDFDVK